MSLPPEIWVLLSLSMATGLVAGVFLAFSDFVMPSLRAASPAAGTQALQLITRKVDRTIFMCLLIGLSSVVAVVAVVASLFLEGPVVTYLMLAGTLYIVGVFIASAIGNIPMNEKLEAMPEGGIAAQNYWPDYVRGWVRWNHLRWISALGASTCYAIGAVLVAAAI